jgi:hypothetical protein
MTNIRAAFNLEAIKGMKFFDPHVHMTSRTTDDYQAMADAGIVALIEPAFGWDSPAQALIPLEITIAVL